MSLYCTLPRGGGSYYHSSIHSSLPSSSASSASTASSSSTITNDSSSIRDGTTLAKNYLKSINSRYQHQQSIATMFNNIASYSSNSTSPQTTLNSNSNSSNSINIDNNVQSVYQKQQMLTQYHQNQQQFQLNTDSSLSLNFRNYPSAPSTPSVTTPVLPSPQGNPFNQLVSNLSNGVNMLHGNTSTGIDSLINNQQESLQPTNQSLQLTIPKPPEPPQRIYYGLDNFDDLKAIRRNSITSLVEDPSTPNFYGDEDSAYDSTSNESLRLTAKELSKRSSSKKYFTLPTKLGRRLRKSSCPEFNNTTHNNKQNKTTVNNHVANSLTPSPVSDCTPSPKLILNGPAFPSSLPSSLKPSSSSTSSSIISSSSSVSPPSTASSLSSSSSSPSSSNMSVSVSPTALPSPSSPILVTEMSSSSQHHQHQLHNHHVDSCTHQQPSSTSSISPSSPSANENVCHCCYLLGCHSNQSSTIPHNTAHHQPQIQQHGRVNPGGVGNINTTNSNNNNPSTGQQSTLETLWEEPSSGHESVRLTEEAIYAAMRELNISLPSKDSVNGQPNRNGNSSSWLRSNFLKAFRRSSSSSSSSKNRSSKIIENSNTSSLIYPDEIKNHHQQQQPQHHHEPVNGSKEASMLINSNHYYQQSHYADEAASNKRTSSGPSIASSLSSLPLSCSSSVPPTPPLTPLPSYHYQQNQQQQLQFNNHHHQQQQQQQQQQQHLPQANFHYGTDEDVIKEMNRQLIEKDQLLQEVCMESINHLNTIENLKELIGQLRGEIDSLRQQNDQLNLQIRGVNSEDVTIKSEFNKYRSNQIQTNSLNGR